MIRIVILDNILETDFTLEQLDMVLKGLHKFAGGFIQLGVQYVLNYNLKFGYGGGHSWRRVIKYNNLNDLNDFVNSQPIAVLHYINILRNERMRLYSESHPALELSPGEYDLNTIYFTLDTSLIL